MKIIKKNYFIFLIAILCVARFFLSFNLPSFYLDNLHYDDKLAIEQAIELKRRKLFRRIF